MVAIDDQRLRETFERYAAIGATENDGLHRLTATDEDRAVRDELVADMEAFDLDVRVDRVGNVFGRRPGTDPDAAPVLVGSHLDSQPSGGRFDGQLGVLAALETVRSLEDEDVETRRPVEVVNWTNEEGSRFKPALLGSGAYTGQFEVEEVLAAESQSGETLGEELERIGYAGDAPVGGDPHSYLELHVEQGPVLDDHGTAVGVVEGVLGMSWMEATIEGQSDHAGPTPMHARNDALVAATEAISTIHSLPQKWADDAVATVGEINVHPNSINVIPDEVRFTVDVRSYDDAVVETAVEDVRSEIETAAAREGCTATVEELWRLPHTEFSPAVADVLVDAATAVDASYERMISGAGHDASYLNDVCETGMLFVPSVDGITHAENEYTEWDDFVDAAAVYANAVETMAS